MWPQWPMAWPKIAPSFGRRNSGRMKFYRFSGLSFHIFPKSVEECHKCVFIVLRCFDPSLVIYPTCFMYGMFTVPTFTPKINEFCRYIFQHHGASGYGSCFHSLFRKYTAAWRRKFIQAIQDTAGKTYGACVGDTSKTDKQFFLKKVKSEILQ